MKVKNDLILDGERLYLRPMRIFDATREYVQWLNSTKVNQYLESRFVKHSVRSVREYITKISRDPNSFFFTIILKSDSKHIGNIKLGPIDWNHKIGDIGIMIGDQDSWGKGYATEAIRIISNFAFKKLNLHKLTAGAYENNIGSIKAFQNAGFSKEGYRQNHFLYKGKYVGHVLLANEKKI